MYQGKHYQKDEHVEKRSRAGKPLAALVALVLILGAVVGGTLAYLAARTDAIVNTFNPAKVDITVEENFDGSTKKDVKITNTGDTEVYIRATYVVNWLDAQGNIVASVPEGYSYTLTENPDSKWAKGNDGYFYYLSPVAPDASTPGSLLTCTVTHPENPEYRLSVEILATAIQSVPADAVRQAWGVSIAPNSVTAYSGN